MLDSLIDAAGIWFLAAVAAEFGAAIAEQAGAARSPEEDRPRGFAAFALGVAALLTPGLLLLHGFLLTVGSDAVLRVWLMGLPMAAMIGGAIMGGVVGATARSAAPTMRSAAAWLAVAALVLAVYAATPSIAWLVQAAQNGWVIREAVAPVR